MLVFVIVYLGVLYNEKGVIVSCGVMFVWFDGCMVIFIILFNISYVMKFFVVGEIGSLEFDDFIFLVSNVKFFFKVVFNMSWKDKFVGWYCIEDF